MFAHLMNRRESLARVRTWPEPDGRLFMYILLISTRIATRSRCGAALALVLPSRISGLFGYADGRECGVSHFPMTAV